MWSLRFAIAIVALSLSCGPIDCVGQQNRIDPAKFQRELRRRVSRDQSARYARINFLKRTSGTGKFDTERFDKLTKKASDIDGDNLAWLKKIEEKHGLPNADQLDQETMDQLFLLFLHADRDPEFRRKVLAHIKSEESGWHDRYANLLETRLHMTEHTQIRIPDPDKK